jgi:hypothetical protein
MKIIEIIPMDLPYWGVDLSPEQRPGVPRESSPHPLAGAHWGEPPRQPGVRPEIARLTRDRLTPVFSTALPPKGLSGKLRRRAYEIPDHRVRHWILLLLADRVDVLQHLVGRRKA